MNERQSSEAEGPSSPRSPGRGVPAVERAVAILRYLAEEGRHTATATELARALDLNVSTCFNIARTLVAARLLSFDPRTKSYELGLALRELATAVDERDQINKIATRISRDLASDVGLTTLLFQWTGDDGFVVIDKVESPQRFRITTSVGQHFPWDAAILSKAYFAWESQEVVDKMIERYPLVSRSETTITNPVRFRRELDAVRRRGFSTSIGEYQPELNAVGAPVFDVHGDVRLVLVVSGFAREFPPDQLLVMGPQVVRAARRITEEIGGEYPRIG